MVLFSKVGNKQELKNYCQYLYFLFQEKYLKDYCVTACFSFSPKIV